MFFSVCPPAGAFLEVVFKAAAVAALARLVPDVLCRESACSWLDVLAFENTGPFHFFVR